MDKKRMLGQSLIAFSISMFFALAVAAIVFLFARHEEQEIIAQMNEGVVQLYQIDSSNGATGLTEWRRPRNDSILEIDKEDTEGDEFDVAPTRPRRLRQQLFDGSRIENIGRGLLWLAGGIVAVCLATSFGLNRITRSTRI